MRVLFATAELAPVARVGGLAAAAAGLVKALRALGAEVDVVLPDYAGLPLRNESVIALDVPPWAGPAVARTGELDGVGPITLIATEAIRRDHPYLDPDGSAFLDNDLRFFAFSTVIADLCRRRAPDVLHLNDWHTSVALAYLSPRPPTVLTIHTLGYQGWTNPGWLVGFPYDPQAYEHEGACNPLAGAIRLADRVIAVSPTYAAESLTLYGGFGVDRLLAAKGDRFVGILNGIDADEWDPSSDPHLPAHYSAGSTSAEVAAAKDAVRLGLRTELGLEVSIKDPLAVVVTRLVEQKGIDLLIPAATFAPTIPVQLAVLGSGEKRYVDALHAAASARPGRVAFREGYDESLAHRMFAAADLFVMPSRFEPCGLAQMQAMRYGAIPVVTDVGGLHDTVIDVDAAPSSGTGVVAGELSSLGVLDALHRAVRAVRQPARRGAMQRRGMSIDWSWDGPARRHLELYESLR